MPRVSFTKKGGDKVKFQSRKSGSSSKTRKKSAYTIFAGKRMKLYIKANYPATEAMKAAAKDWRDKQDGKKLVAKPSPWKGKKLPTRRKATKKRATSRAARPKSTVKASTTRKRKAPAKKTASSSRRGKFDLDQFLKL